MKARVVTATTTAAVLVAPDGSAGVPCSVLVAVPSGAPNTVFVGGSDVDGTTNGFQIVAGSVASFDLINESLWVITVGGNQAISYIKSGN